MSTLFEPWSPERDDADRELAEVLALHKLNKKTLGFMPDQAFSQRAAHNGLILALSDSAVVVGYALYDLPRSHIKLVHVCVDAGQRKTGLAKQLVDFVIENNSQRSGILAACRNDYGLDGFWKSLAMTTRSERNGRSSKGSTLKIWWRPLGALDLFESAALHSKLPTAVLDTNVVSDLFASPAFPRADREEASALAADWLVDVVELVVSPQVDNELDRISDVQERKHQQRLSSALRRLRSSEPTGAAIELDLLGYIGEKALARDPSLRDDVKHLADAVHAEASYFVTSDTALIGRLGQRMREDHDLRIMHPFELVVELISEPGQPPFESHVLESVNLTWEPAEAFSPDQLTDIFLNHAGGEKAKAFRRRLRESIAHTAEGGATVLVDDERLPVALVATRKHGRQLIVPMVRTGRDRRGSTVAFQLVRHLRRIALKSDLDTVLVTDDELVGPVLESLAADGFVNATDGPTATLSTAVGPEHLPEGTYESSATVAAVERQYWPLLIDDNITECWVTPVRPEYAEMLFGFGETLFTDRHLGLGLSREHVYYRSPKKPLPQNLPARILWFVSGDNRKNNVRQIIARSRIIESQTLPVDEAYDRFRHLGVYRRDQVRGAADENGMVNVIRFEDTELFERAIGRAELDPIIGRYSVKMPFLTLRKIPPALFHEIVATQPAFNKATNDA